MLRPAIFIILLGISLLYFFSRSESPDDQAAVSDTKSSEDLMETSESLTPKQAANQNQETIEVIMGDKK